MTRALIVARIHRELTAQGFARFRKKATWNRHRGALVEVIDVQTSMHGGSVTMNIGVLERGVYFASWCRDAGLFVEAPECTVEARIGRLIDRLDRWWDVGSASAADEMVSCINEYALPFLGRMQSLEAMRDWLASFPQTSVRSLYFAVLLSKLGDMDRARAAFVEMERKARGDLKAREDWKARLKEVAARIGCDYSPSSDH